MNDNKGVAVEWRDSTQDWVVVWRGEPMRAFKNRVEALEYIVGLEALKAGDSVRLKPTMFDEINHQIRGGEGRIGRVFSDDKGLVYVIVLNRGNIRLARAEQLVKHRAKEGKAKR
jgi:hypothetical protein